MRSKNWNPEEIQRGTIPPEKFGPDELYIYNKDGKLTDQGRSLRPFQYEFESYDTKAIIAAYIYEAVHDVESRGAINKGLQAHGLTNGNIDFNKFSSLSSSFKGKYTIGKETSEKDLTGFFEEVDKLIKNKNYRPTKKQRDFFRKEINEFKYGSFDKKTQTYTLGWDIAQKFISNKIDELSEIKTNSLDKILSVKGDSVFSAEKSLKSLEKRGVKGMSVSEIYEKLDYYNQLFEKTSLFRDSAVTFEEEDWNIFVEDYAKMAEISANKKYPTPKFIPPKQIDPKKPVIDNLQKFATNFEDKITTLNKGLKSYFSFVRKALSSRFSGVGKAANVQDLVRNTEVSSNPEMSEVSLNYLIYNAEKTNLAYREEGLKVSNSLFVSSKFSQEIRLSKQEIFGFNLLDVFKNDYTISRIAERKNIHPKVLEIKLNFDDKMYNIYRRMKPKIGENQTYEYVNVADKIANGESKYIDDIYRDLEKQLNTKKSQEAFKTLGISFKLPSKEEFLKQDIFEKTHKELVSLSQEMYFNTIQNLDIKNNSSNLKFRETVLDAYATHITKIDVNDLTKFEESKRNWAEDRVAKINSRKEIAADIATSTLIELVKKPIITKNTLPFTPPTQTKA